MPDTSFLDLYVRELFTLKNKAIPFEARNIEVGQYLVKKI
jgi:hypothetical protein